MKRNFKMLMSMVMTLVMVISSVSITNISAIELTTEQIVANGIYNLALSKKITANPTKQEGNETALSDGNLAGQHAATTFGTPGTYFLVDLGAVYDATTIEQIVVKYKENSDGDTPVKGYEIQFSTNSLDYTTVKKVDGAVVKDACTNNDLIDIQELEVTEGAVRYIKIYYPDSYNWGIQAREIAVLDTDGDAKIVEVEKCDPAAGVEVTSTDYNSLTYKITAGENQEGYKYIVYMDDTQLIGNGVDAGVEYTIQGVAGGYHAIKVIAAYNGMASNPIYGEIMNVPDISSLFAGKRNLANKNNNLSVSVVEMSSIYDGHTMTTAQVALDGKLSTGEGSAVALRTGSGSPQYVVIDLGDYYVASEFDRVLLAHTNGSTYPADVKVEFSLDGTTYSKVGNSTGYKYSSTASINSIMLDGVEDYTQAAVRYVKLTLSAGGSNWGYVINEIGLMTNTDTPTIKGSDIPEAADVIIDTELLETIKYTVVAGEGQEDAAYVIKLDGQIVNSSAVAGTEYVIDGVEAGTHDLTVCTLQDGWQSKGLTKQAVVDGYINYLKKPLNLALRSAHPNVTVTCDNDNYGDNYLTGSQDISAGVDCINDSVYDNYAHHGGYLQTRPDNDEANIIYDLAHDYLPTEIHSVIAAYENNGHCATEYEILFSADGENYERVFYIKGAKFSQFMTDLVDVSSYTQDTVRYVKYHIINGNYGRHYKDDGSINWGSSGYHLCELAVMGKESLLPEKVTGFTAESPEYNKVVVKWIDIADPDATYRVYLNNASIGQDIAPGVQTMEFTITAGTYELSVAAVIGEFASTCKSITVKVEEETTTPAPTTPKPTTQKPTTQKPTTQKPTVAPTQAPTEAPTIATKPGKAKIKIAIAGKKKVSLKLKKVKGAKGYQIKYATNKKFKKAKTKMSKGINVVIKKLKKGKKYYFKARAYKKVNGSKFYGRWSNVKASKKVK